MQFAFLPKDLFACASALTFQWLANAKSNTGFSNSVYAIAKIGFGKNSNEGFEVAIAFAVACLLLFGFCGGGS